MHPSLSMQRSAMQQQQPQVAAATRPTTSLAASAPPAATGRRLPYVLLYLLPLASLVYLLLLPHHPLVAQKIYTDENAWAADGAREAVSSAHVQHAQHVQRRLLAAADGSIRDVIAHTWREAGLDVHSYRHLHDTRGRWTGAASELTYAVVPARMADGKEAVALVVDYDPLDARAAAADSSMSAVAVVSGLAHYLRGQQRSPHPATGSHSLPTRYRLSLYQRRTACLCRCVLAGS